MSAQSRGLHVLSQLKSSLHNRFYTLSRLTELDIYRLRNRLRHTCFGMFAIIFINLTSRLNNNKYIFFITGWKDRPVFDNPSYRLALKNGLIREVQRVVFRSQTNSVWSEQEFLFDHQLLSSVICSPALVWSPALSTVQPASMKCNANLPNVNTDARIFVSAAEEGISLVWHMRHMIPTLAHSLNLFHPVANNSRWYILKKYPAQTVFLYS